MGDAKDTLQKFYNNIKFHNAEEAYIVAALTDNYIVGCWDINDIEKNKADFSFDTDKILEIRVFSVNREYKLIKSTSREKLIGRKIDDADDEEKYRDYFDEIQVLDINTKIDRGQDGKVESTNGGKYYLPIVKAGNKEAPAKYIRVRYYFGKYESGQARIEDWRLVDFENGGEDNGNI